MVWFSYDDTMIVTWEFNSKFFCLDSKQKNKVTMSDFYFIQIDKVYVWLNLDQLKVFSLIQIVVYVLYSIFFTEFNVKKKMFSYMVLTLIWLNLYSIYFPFLNYSIKLTNYNLDPDIKFTYKWFFCQEMFFCLMIFVSFITFCYMDW